MPQDKPLQPKMWLQNEEYQSVCEHIRSVRTYVFVNPQIKFWLLSPEELILIEDLEYTTRLISLWRPRLVFYQKQVCKMSVPRDVQIVMQILDRAHMANTICLLHTVMLAARGQLQVPLLRYLGMIYTHSRAQHIQTSTSTTDYTLYARVPVNRSFEEIILMITEKGEERSRVRSH